MSFEHPVALWLVLPWALFAFWFWRRQRRSLASIEKRVDRRFRPLLSAYDRGSLRRHVFLLTAMGAFLIAAAAGLRWGDAEPRGIDRGRLLLLVDASASMYANDLEGIESRLEGARTLALELVRDLQDHRFALVSFSGEPTIHLPITDDRALVESALETLEGHNFFRGGGSSLTGALDAALRFAEEGGPGLEVVLLGDGELPRKEDYGAPLAALSEAGIVVHAVAFGSLEGQRRVIYDLRVEAEEGEERPRLQEFTTRRVDEHLERIAKKTGGSFAVVTGESELDRAIEELGTALRETRGAPSAGEPRDLELWLLVAFLIHFLLDVFGFLGPRRSPPAGPRFDVERLGERRRAGAGLALLVVAPMLLGCGHPLWRAHLENERGIANDEAGEHADAATHYRRSLGFDVRREIPTYNLARSATLAGDYATAHDLYQDALELEPALAPAYYNDAIALYRWGEAERDPKGCQLERTRELWGWSLRRFEDTIEEAGEEPLGRSARVGREFVEERLAEIDALILEPPEECEPPPPDESSSSSESPPPPPPPESSPPPPAGGGGGLSPEELEHLRGELEHLRGELERIAAQVREEGKYHRRTGAEQFPEESWENLDPEIWW